MKGQFVDGETNSARPFEGTGKLCLLQMKTPITTKAADMTLYCDLYFIASMSLTVNRLSRGRNNRTHVHYHGGCNGFTTVYHTKNWVSSSARDEIRPSL